MALFTAISMGKTCVSSDVLWWKLNCPSASWMSNKVILEEGSPATNHAVAFNRSNITFILNPAMVRAYDQQDCIKKYWQFCRRCRSIKLDSILNQYVATNAINDCLFLIKNLISIVMRYSKLSFHEHLISWFDFCLFPVTYDVFLM